MGKSNLQKINENLPLIDLELTMEKQIEQAKKKVRFVEENPGLFNSTGSYVMTLHSTKRELDKLQKGEKLKESIKGV